VLLAHSLRVVLHTATPHERTEHTHTHTHTTESKYHDTTAHDTAEGVLFELVEEALVDPVTEVLHGTSAAAKNDGRGVIGDLTTGLGVTVCVVSRRVRVVSCVSGCRVVCRVACEGRTFW
jgi:hypothetical protein